MKRLLPISLFLAGTVLLTGCYNSERINETTQISTTLGQEIIDLKTALDQGAIDQREYRLLIEELAENRLGVSLEKPAADDNSSDD